MYYRRKVILALLEKFGGELKPTHFQKLLLLFTRRQRKPAYEFVPYKYGAFSFQARADKGTMIKYGQLKDAKQWVFSAKQSYLGELNKTDQKILDDLWKQFRHISTEELVKYTYREYPFYATRSEIAKELLTDDELKRVEFSRPQNQSKKLYTIGYEGISAEEYMNRLYSKRVNLLVDVRKNSMSMKYGFSKSQLKNMCQKMGIEFMHIPELGIESNKRQNLDTSKDYELLFKEYEQEILSQRKNQLNQLIELFEKYERVAITCFEKEHLSCHRHKISDYLHAEYEVPIEHI
ncbi:DUF488 domain-containing protein [Rhodohalobacter sp.]|uniref:DUF488 domain-containing protein n=1 Tax=Rhodohalobacter sp. TaxID=1974210 RepID=UPI002ACDD819|nr:DUF488 domain-containing protein [Rhodohalobacter sp.]MDZ7754780.1 DUF488 domain-containing protein [Rhodohalobacter sp.]